MHKILTAFVLALSLGTSIPVFFDSFWSHFSTLWSSAKEGCGMDPNGQCQPAPSDQADEGCGMDPSGRCLPGS